MCCSSIILPVSETSIFSYYAALNIPQKQAQYLVIITGRSDPDSPTQKINASISQNNVAFPPLDISSTSKFQALQNHGM